MEVFKLFDRDNSGSISSSELQLVFDALEIKATEEECNGILKQMDIDGDGEISFKEFKRVMASQFFKTYTKAEIKAAFRHFDKDNSGTISCDELKQVLSKMGRHYTKQQIAMMIEKVDHDGNGTISIDEFTSLLE